MLRASARTRCLAALVVIACAVAALIVLRTSSDAPLTGGRVGTHVPERVWVLLPGGTPLGDHLEISEQAHGAALQHRWACVRDQDPTLDGVLVFVVGRSEPSPNDKRAKTYQPFGYRSVAAPPLARNVRHEFRAMTDTELAPFIPDWVRK